ncbi:MAG TPA: hypothetical protein VHG51_20310, partial [Longimicrobiaceae bacterium]|nr:hypothetical protein [Longimicrobiaceae bacterium]
PPRREAKGTFTEGEMKAARTMRWMACLLVAAAVGLAGCADAGTGIEGQTPAGLVVVDASGAPVASANGAQVTGRIEVERGQQQTFTVELLAQDGSEIALGGRYTLQPRVVITPLATVSVSGSDRLVVTGNSPGTTSLVVDVMDGATVVMGPLIPLAIT